MAHSQISNVLRGWESLNIAQKVACARTLANKGVRSDTLFKRLCATLLHPSECSASPYHIASVLVAMKELRMSTEATKWWNRVRDCDKLTSKIENGFTSEAISCMTSEQLMNCIAIVGNCDKDEITSAIMQRVRVLIETEEKDGDTSNMHFVAHILKTLAKTRKSRLSIDSQRWMAEWLCRNVYRIKLEDIISINQSLCKFGFRNHSYHKIWIPYYLEKIDELSKDDISIITDTFNSVGMTDSSLGSRHFFYKLGKKFQQLTVSSNGDQHLHSVNKYRCHLQRLG